MNGPRQLMVKITLPDSTVSPLTKVQVKTIDSAVNFTTPLTKPIGKRLAGKKYAYFYAIIDGVGRDAKLVEIKANGSYQGW